MYICIEKINSINHLKIYRYENISSILQTEKTLRQSLIHCQLTFVLMTHIILGTNTLLILMIILSLAMYLSPTKKILSNTQSILSGRNLILTKSWYTIIPMMNSFLSIAYRMNHWPISNMPNLPMLAIRPLELPSTYSRINYIAPGLTQVPGFLLSLTQ